MYWKSINIRIKSHDDSWKRQTSESTKSKLGQNSSKDLRRRQKMRFTGNQTRRGQVTKEGAKQA